MANKLTADEVVQMQHVRGFIQLGEPGPDNELIYYGKSAQYFFVESLSAPERGSISPLRVGDPMQRRAYRLIGRQIEPPDLATYNLILLEKHGRVPRALGKSGCEFNLYLSVGRCKEPSDPDRGWEDYWHVLDGGLVTDKDHGNRSGMTDDTQLQSTLTVTLADEYAVGPLSFAASAASNIAAEAFDATFGMPSNCDDCNDGTDWRYILVGPKAASPPAAPKLTYTVDAGASWTDLAITGIGTGATVAALRIVGAFLVALVPSEDAYYYTEINDLTGVPSSTWTKVTTGFVGAGTPNDIYVASPTEVWFCGDAGYLYKSGDIPAGVSVVSAGDVTTENLKRIAGIDEVIVAVGANGTILVSENAGEGFGTAADNGSITDTIQALAVVTARRWWIGTSAGETWWTKTGGESWTEKVIDSTITAVQDIQFATRSVGFVLGSATGPDARVWGTTNGGRSWNRTRARLVNVPIADRYNRIATPNTASSQTNSNMVLLVGLAGDGADGIAIVGAAAEL